MNDEERSLDLQLGDALAEIDQLRAERDALKAGAQMAIKLLGPTAPDCCGCEYEWNQAITQLQAALEKQFVRDSIREFWPEPPHIANPPKPKKPWVGLTDEENHIAEVLNKTLGLQYVADKLQEKNT